MVYLWSISPTAEWFQLLHPKHHLWEVSMFDLTITLAPTNILRSSDRPPVLLMSLGTIFCRLTAPHVRVASTRTPMGLVTVASLASNWLRLLILCTHDFRSLTPGEHHAKITWPQKAKLWEKLCAQNFGVRVFSYLTFYGTVWHTRGMNSKHTHARLSCQGIVQSLQGSLFSAFCILMQLFKGRN